MKDNPHAGTRGDDNSEIQKKLLTADKSCMIDTHHDAIQPE